MKKAVKKIQVNNGARFAFSARDNQAQALHAAQKNSPKTKMFVGAFMCLVLAAVCFFTFTSVGFAGAQASSAECMITIESNTNRVLYAKNAHKKRPMASVTKILTAITVLENCKDLDEKRVVPKQAVGVEGSSIYLGEGEQISTRDLLYGLMLQSGNDCAAALAILTAGSIPDFAVLMNATAQKAGAKNSNFVNPHGLHHDDHYTTAYDLAVITSYAMRNKDFAEIAASKTRKIERTRENAPVIIVNKNKLLHSFEGADGVKTGFTKRAGRCLVSSATRDGMQVISVVLNCGPMFEDCAALMNRAFAQYKFTKIATAGEPLAKIKVLDGRMGEAQCGVGQDVYYPLKDGETVKTEIKMLDYVVAPQKIGEIVGEVSFSLDNRLLFCRKLIMIEDAPLMSLSQCLEKAIKEW